MRTWSIPLQIVVNAEDADEALEVIEQDLLDIISAHRVVQTVNQVGDVREVDDDGDA